MNFLISLKRSIRTQFATLPFPSGRRRNDAGVPVRSKHSTFTGAGGGLLKGSSKGGEMGCPAHASQSKCCPDGHSLLSISLLFYLLCVLSQSPSVSSYRLTFPVWRTLFEPVAIAGVAIWEFSNFPSTVEQTSSKRSITVQAGFHSGASRRCGHPPSPRQQKS